MTPKSAKAFLAIKARALGARARRLAKLTPGSVGLRPGDRQYAPSMAHFRAANRRLARIDRDIAKRLAFLRRHMRTSSPENTLTYMALVEREIDRARRAFGMFFDIFSQRGSAFAPTLAAHDLIAGDCYAAVRASAPHVFKGDLLRPITYMEHGYSPATTRRGVSLGRLLGERNPFPIIRLPWDRDNPWQAVFLHEVSHNLQADLGLWQENKNAVSRRMLRAGSDMAVTSVYTRWHKEVFADVAAVLLGGPASVWGSMDFLAHPSPKTMTFKPRGVHPTGYLRVLILAELLKRMGFGDEATRVRRVWTGLYHPAKGHRMPVRLLKTSPRTIPEVVDEIAYQARRNLGQRALADVIRFGHGDERRIRRGASELAGGRMPSGLPPRFFVSASRYALHRGANIPALSHMVINHLSKRAADRSRSPMVSGLAVAGGYR
ncbi:hypothetical protein DENIS_1378 [Desulfonema ishimotonii]|uniref:Uncharacterized protein n=1 Tax=Desulfonema ishimotonii TaxID=45657 RepID=A0A401FTY1_9BACT|nr:hypothetical protein [Desulfonema ishimotonii]GBC60426.1 hypothetical protein DENIS_1378 [Desulfonema ishimotonii]